LESVLEGSFTVLGSINSGSTVRQNHRGDRNMSRRKLFTHSGLEMEEAEVIWVRITFKVTPVTHFLQPSPSS
jgi:acyl-coenzyme A thioesterase PaaI-like protein